MKPFNLQAEQAILAAAMLDIECAGKILDVDFLDNRNKILKSAIKYLFLNSIEIDPISIIEIVKKNGKNIEIDYIMDLVSNVSAPSTFVHHLDIQTETVKAAKLWDECQTTLRKLSEGERDLTDGLINRLISKDSGSLELVSAMDSASETLDYITTMYDAVCSKEPPPFGIPYGIPVLDRITNGLHNEDLICIAAKTGEGKSAFMNQLALNISFLSDNPKKGLLISLEMKHIQNMIRLIASQTSIDNYRLRGGKLYGEDYKNAMKIAAKLSEGKFWYGRGKNRHIDTIIATILRAKAKVDIDYAMVDYIQLVEGAGGSKYEKVSDAVGKLKGLAESLDIPIIIASQINRSSSRDLSNKMDTIDNPIPVIEHLKESGQIENDSGTILFVHADKIYKDKGDLPNEVPGRIILAKNRGGECTSFEMVFHRPYLRFEFDNDWGI